MNSRCRVRAPLRLFQFPTMHWVLVAAATCALATWVASAADAPELVPQFSFRGPFKTFDSEGIRKLDNYNYGGSSELNENFIRMTPDRAVSAATAPIAARLAVATGLAVQIGWYLAEGERATTCATRWGVGAALPGRHALDGFFRPGQTLSPSREAASQCRTWPHPRALLHTICIIVLAAVCWAGYRWAVVSPLCGVVARVVCGVVCRASVAGCGAGARWRPTSGPSRCGFESAGRESASLAMASRCG